MIDREALHRLVDSLPEEALPSVERAMQWLQTWPPVIPGAEKMRERMDAVIGGRKTDSAYLSAVEYKDARGESSGSWSGASLSFAGGSRAHATGRIRGKDLDIEIHHFEGQEIQIERQVRVSTENRRVTYAVTVRGPDGTEVHREMKFEMMEGPYSDLNRPSPRRRG